MSQFLRKDFLSLRQPSLASDILAVSSASYGRQPIQTLFLNGEPETARLTLRDLVNATVGFERLAKATGRPLKSLHA